jgi:two-component system NarL family sensor kinase
VVVGRLVVGWEYGPMLRERDDHVLTELVGPLALAVGWVRLTGDLRRTSVAVVSAREEERRRLWRDLHDGLGPALYSVSMGLRTQIRRTERDDAHDVPALRAALERLAEDVDSISSDLRRIVRDLAPAALEQLGLVGALEQFARGCESQIDIHTSLPADRVVLPAAVELASYRIVTEAVTNVLRHARADRCWLTITAGETVEIDIVDDGIGINGRAHDGFGIPSIRERAEELGGSAEFQPNHPRGTRVHACLPAQLPACRMGTGSTSIAGSARTCRRSR